MEKIFARFIQVLFHPLLVATLGMFILFRTNLYIVFISEQIRQVVLLTTFAATCLIPLVIIMLSDVFRTYLPEDKKLTGMRYLFIAISYFLGYYFLSKIPLSGFLKAGFLAGILVLIMLSLISMQWNISSHMAGLGALTGVAVSVMLRFGVYNPAFFAAVILAGGFTGFSRLVLEKNSPAQIYAGYVLGFGILFLVYSLI